METKKDYIFLFDLDSTITKVEILPEISKKLGMEDEMRRLTEATMQGVIPFKASFLRRVDLLKSISVQDINEYISNIPLNEAIVSFINEYSDRCYVVTGNLDVWISGLMKKIGLKGHNFCSRAIAQNDAIQKVVSVLDKKLTVQQFVQPLVAVGDGDNDSGMVLNADIGIGFGGVRPIAPSLIRSIDYAFYDDARLASFLRSLV